MPFERLHGLIRQNLLAKDMVSPTSAQEKAIPEILNGSNVLLIAPTGIGKTEAAVLPILHNYLLYRESYRREIEAEGDEGESVGIRERGENGRIGDIKESGGSGEIGENGRIGDRVKIGEGGGSRDITERRRGTEIGGSAGRVESGGGVEKGESEGGNPPGISILYITPLRALNRDMLRRMKEWGEALKINVAVRHGDTTQYERTKQSKNPPDFLITTPETLQIMFTGRRLREHLSNVQWVIVDEIHEMAADDRGAQLSVALERLAERAGEFQRIGLSATIGEPRKVGLFLAGSDRHVSIVKIKSMNKKEVMVERAVVTDEDHELSEQLQAWPELIAALKRANELIQNYHSTLLFVNTRDTAEVISSRMKLYSLELPVGIHHGSLSKDIRVEMEEGFKDGDLKALICTSSMELGIDVGRTDLVIQYNSPRQVERFLQRLGRAGHRTELVSRGVILAVGPDEIAESMVIGYRSLKEELEGFDIRYSPLDVLSNQIVALTMEYRTMELKRAYSIIKRSHPFWHLKEETFSEIISDLTHAGVIWSDEEHFGKGKRSIGYFYNNISMIPDQKTYLIRDITTRKIVGTLDEAFAITLESKGTFIIRGNNWNFVRLDEGEVLVEPAPNLGILPDWVGEDIPVPYSVAMDVGEIRRLLGEKNIALDELVKEYPITKEAMDHFLKYVDSQITKGISIPSDRLVTIENGGKLCIVNGCFGSKVNETFGQLLSALVSARLGTAVKFTTDPYRIIIESSRRIDPTEIQEILTTFPPATVRSMLHKLLRNSSYLRWQFFHVARKFGIISADADLHRINLDSYIEQFRDSMVYKEAIDKVIWDKMDVKRTRKVLDLIHEGKIDIRITPVSPIGAEGLENRKELMNPERASHTILKALKARLENNVTVLICMNCGSSSRRRIKDLPQRIGCRSCGGNMVASVPAHHRKFRNLVTKKLRKKGKLKVEENKELKDLMTNASLVMAHGKSAVIVLSGRGVGPKTAGRILGKLHRDEYDLYREILKAEIIFARTSRFWA